MIKTQHMFSSKACHYLPSFLLASPFPRELWMSSHWQCSVLAITLEKQESGLLLKFQRPKLNASSETAAEVACPMKPGSSEACWRRGRLADPFLQNSCAHGSLVLQLVMLGGTRWGAMREPHPQSPHGTVAIPFSLL